LDRFENTDFPVSVTGLEDLLSDNPSYYIQYLGYDSVSTDPSDYSDSVDVRPIYWRATNATYDTGVTYASIVPGTTIYLEYVNKLLEGDTVSSTIDITLLVNNADTESILSVAEIGDTGIFQTSIESVDTATPNSGDNIVQIANTTGTLTAQISLNALSLDVDSYEDFESYADKAALNAVWNEIMGTADLGTDSTNYIILSDEPGRTDFVASVATVDDLTGSSTIDLSDQTVSLDVTVIDSISNFASDVSLGFPVTLSDFAILLIDSGSNFAAAEFDRNLFTPGQSINLTVETACDGTNFFELIPGDCLEFDFTSIEETIIGAAVNTATGLEVHVDNLSFTTSSLIEDNQTINLTASAVEEEEEEQEQENNNNEGSGSNQENNEEDNNEEENNEQEQENNEEGNNEEDNNEQEQENNQEENGEEENNDGSNNGGNDSDDDDDNDDNENDDEESNDDQESNGSENDDDSDGESTSGGGGNSDGDDRASSPNYVAEVQYERTENDLDNDKDGCSNAHEIKSGTNPNIFDSVVPGISDCDVTEILGETVKLDSDFITVNAGSQTSYQFVATGAVHFEEGSSTGSQVRLQLVDQDNFTIDLGTTTVDANQLYIKMNDVELKDGSYLLIASTTDQTGKTIRATDTLTIDSTKNADITLKNFSGIQFEDNLPVGSSNNQVLRVNKKTFAFGEAPRDSKVTAYWNSVLLTSISLSDSSTGTFYVEPREELSPDEIHTLILVAENSEDSEVKSVPLVVKFRIKENNNLLWLFLSVSLLLAGLAFQFLRKPKVQSPVTEVPVATSSYTGGMIIGLVLSLSVVVSLGVPQTAGAYDKVLTYQQKSEIQSTYTQASVFSLSSQNYTGEPILKKQSSTLIPDLGFSSSALPLNLTIRQLSYFYLFGGLSALLLLSLSLLLHRKIRHKIVQSPTTPLHML
jgi:hypothetical protein